MENNLTPQERAKQAIEKAIQSIDNGIIIEYHDSLHCDAFNIRVRKDGKDASFTETYSYPGYSEKDKTIRVHPLEQETNGLHVIMVGNSEYYGSVGLRSTISMLVEGKFYNFPVYVLDLGWYTFPSKYLPVKESWLDSLSDFITKDEQGIKLSCQDWFKMTKSMLHVDYTPEE